MAAEFWSFLKSSRTTPEKVAGTCSLVALVGNCKTTEFPLTVEEVVLEEEEVVLDPEPELDPWPLISSKLTIWN